jgi:hypothetical protein
MKLFYLRPRRRMALDYLPESLDYFQRIVLNGGTISSISMKAADDLVRALLNANLWWKILDMGLFAGDQLAAAMVKLKYTTGPGVLVNNNFVAADFVEQGASGGLHGDGSTKSLRTGLPQNAVGATGHIAFYLREDFSPGFYECVAGVSVGGDDYLLMQADTSIQTRFGQTQIAIRTDLTRGFWCGGREADGTLSLYKNGLLQQANATPVTPVGTSQDFYVFAKNNNGVPVNYVDRRGGFYCIGQALTAADQASLYGAVQAFQQALNRAV